MRILSIFFILIFFYSSVLSKDIVARFGFMANIEALSDFKYVKASINKLVKGIGTNYADIRINFYDDINDLHKDFKRGKLDILGINPDYYFEHEDKFLRDSTDYWTLSYKEKNNMEYCLISNKNKKLNNFRVLKNSSLVLKNTDTIAYQWIDKNSLQYNKKSVDKVVKKIIYSKKESTVVLNIFFQKYDLGLVKKVTLETMIELNPKIKKTLNVLACSGNSLIPILGFFYKKTYNLKNARIFFQLTNNFKDSEERNVSVALNFNHVYRLNKNHLNSIRTFYKEYRFLKNKYVRHNRDITYENF